MRFIEGRNLAEVIDGKPLPSRTAARYIEQIARAVDYAHTRNVLHRDIKPRNILIDAADRAYITDFGLAKLLGEVTASLTTATGGLGSPPYMSPEQWREPARAEHSSDIYSLGATLYEAIAGRPPFRADTLLQLHILVLEKTPPASRGINPNCARDLETICLKCLEKEPSRRYATALDVADDLRRYLDRRPIKARRVGTTERAIKWIKKHPTPVALAVVTAVATGALLIDLRLRRALDDAERGYSQARQVIDSVSRFGIRHLHDHSQLKELTRILMDEHRDFLKRRLSNAGFAEESATVLNRMARLMDLVGSDADALTAYQEALPLRRSISAAKPEDSRSWMQLAETLHNIGMHQNDLGQPDAALASYREALDIRSRLARSAPRDRDILADLARSYGRLGDWQIDNGEPQEAKESYDKALEIREQLVQSNKSDWVAQLQLARSLNNSGHFEREVGDRDRAIKWHREAAKLQHDLVEFSRSVPRPLHYEDDIRGLIFEPWDLASDLAGSHYHMGVLYTEGGKSDQAVTEHDACISLLERLAQEQPGVAEFRGALALALNYRALLVSSREDLGRAESILVDLLRDTPGVIRFEAGLIRNHATAGELEWRAGQSDEGCEMIENAYDAQRKLAMKHPRNRELQRTSIWINSLRKGLPGSAKPAGEPTRS
jgi:tetratricopeptide (TPR) repeat protein